MKICKNCNRKFKPIKPKQEDCSEACLVNRFDTHVRKTRALARIFANTMGYRSMGEVRFAAKLRTAAIPFAYENDVLVYKHKPQKYVVDFTLPLNKTNNPPKILLEYKGKLDAISRRKMRAVKDSNPDLDIRFVFEKPHNKLYKGAKMRYWEWAERYGFGWYDVRDVKQIRKDLTEAKKLSTQITNW